MLLVIFCASGCNYSSNISDTSGTTYLELRHMPYIWLILSSYVNSDTNKLSVVCVTVV
jgi:hypothetical protein